MTPIKMTRSFFAISLFCVLSWVTPILVGADEKPQPGDGMLTCTTMSAPCYTTCAAMAATDCPPESNIDYCYILSSRDFTLGIGDDDDGGEPGGGGGVSFPPPDDEDSVGIPLLDDLLNAYKKCPVKFGTTDGSTPPPPNDPPENPWEDPLPPPLNPPPRYFTITFTLGF